MTSHTDQPLDEIMTRIRAEWPTLQPMGVKSLGIFGSRVRGTARSGADLDVLVRLAPNSDLLDLIGIRLHLEAILGFKVDITTEGGLRSESRDAILSDVRWVV